MLIVLNHKMNLNINEIISYEEALREYEDVVVMPQIPYMGLFSKGKYILGSQFISEDAVTGGISAESLVSLNVKYVLAGHSERRIIKGETDEEITQKINEVVRNGMRAILCIGESLSSKEAGLTKELLEEQIHEVFSKLAVPYHGVIIAYEPVWSIGTGKIPTMEELDETISFIKAYLKNKYGSENKVLYGGSVNSKNIEELKKLENLDGLLIGGASLKIEEVSKIYNSVNNLK